MKTWEIKNDILRQMDMIRLSMLYFLVTFIFIFIFIFMFVIILEGRLFMNIPRKRRLYIILRQTNVCITQYCCAASSLYGHHMISYTLHPSIHPSIHPTIHPRPLRSWAFIKYFCVVQRAIHEVKRKSYNEVEVSFLGCLESSIPGGILNFVNPATQNSESALWLVVY